MFLQNDSVKLDQQTSQDDDDPDLNNYENDYNIKLEDAGEKAVWLTSNGSLYDCGFYQIASFIFISITWTIANGWYAYVSVFTGYTPDFKCDTSSMTNISANTDLDLNCNFLDSSNNLVKCTKWTYDRSQMASTIVTEFDLVCERNYYFELAYSLEQIGYILGTLVFSFIADKIGRKPVFIGVLVGMSVLGIVQYFVTDLVIYFVFGFFINSLSCGLEAVCITLVLEMFITSRRTFFGMSIEVIWVVLLATLSPIAYFIKQWRELRLFIFISISVLVILSFFLLQESIRWLISVEQIKKAERIVNRIIKYNRIDKTEEFMKSKAELQQIFKGLDAYSKDQKDLKNKVHEIKRKTDTIYDVVRNSKFRNYIMIMALNWFATSIVYDGLTYMNNHIGENIFLNWIAMNMIELPAQVMCFIVISKYGRRLTVSVTLIVSGFLLLATCSEIFDFIKNLSWFKFFLFVAAKFTVTQSYSAIILHSPEMFPTNLRTFGYGISLFSGKLTAILSPMISIYLGKLYPVLPSIIYGAISIICGLISFYVPETLNRPLPNCIDDVVKWPRTLTEQEKKIIHEMNKNELKKVKRIITCCRQTSLKQHRSEKSNVKVSILVSEKEQNAAGTDPVETEETEEPV